MATLTFYSTDKTGVLSDLTTTDKDSLVDAINEVDTNSKSSDGFSYNIVEPDMFGTSSFIPSGHVANGFTADDTYFYIASHISDTDPVYINRVTRSTMELYDSTATSITGHGNGLSIYNNALYVTDSTNFKIDVLSLDDFSLTGTMTLASEGNANSVWVGELDSTPYLVVNEWYNKSISTYEISNGYLLRSNRFALSESPNQYIQGLDCTYDCFYLSFSYGTYKRPYQALPRISAYAWDGHLLNSIFINLLPYDQTTQYELEDIWYDADNSLIYFTTGSGHIYSVSTAYFTTSQTHHQCSAYSFRRNPFFSMINGQNANPVATYYNSTKLVQSYPMTSASTKNQGIYTGVGLVAGNMATYCSRNGDLIGWAINTNPNTELLYACVQYTIGSGTITYSRGYVATLVDGVFTVTDLQTYSTSNPTLYTCINVLNHQPYAIYPTESLIEFIN